MNSDFLKLLTPEHFVFFHRFTICLATSIIVLIFSLWFRAYTPFEKRFLCIMPHAWYTIRGLWGFCRPPRGYRESDLWLLGSNDFLPGADSFRLDWTDTIHRNNMDLLVSERVDTEILERDPDSVWGIVWLQIFRHALHLAGCVWFDFDRDDFVVLLNDVIDLSICAGTFPVIEILCSEVSLFSEYVHKILYYQELSRKGENLPTKIGNLCHLEVFWAVWLEWKTASGKW